MASATHVWRGLDAPRLEGSHRPETPSFDLELDEKGFVTRYPGLAERTGWSETG